MPGNYSHINELRLASQQLNGSAFTTPEEMVKWFGAVQGQEYAQSKWMLGSRLPKLTDKDIENKLTDGTILRTHLLRPTWHFATAEDIYWLLMLTAPRVHTVNAFMYRQLELDTALFKKSNKIIAKVLKGNNQLTRDEINSILKKHKIEAAGHRLSYIMMHAELNGIICSGARRGNKFTYALLEERAKNSRRYNKEDALAELTKRYFQSRGPATINDFSTWSGLTLAECRQGIEMINAGLQRLLHAKNEHYFIPPHIVHEYSINLYLLPIYDEYIMGYKDRSAMLELKNNLQQAYSFSFDCTIIYKGQIIGTWKRTIGNKEIDVFYQFFKPLTDKQKKEFKNSVERFSEFNKLPVTLHKE